MNIFGAAKKNSNKIFRQWSKNYDRSFLQHIVFKKAHNMFMCEINIHPAKDGMRLLDVGCGTGEFASRVSDHPSRMELEGVDLSPHMVEVANSKFMDNEDVSFKLGDVEHLPYENDAFDIITCSHSFHHYPDQKRAVSEMHRVLKPGGKLMIIDGSKDNILGKFIYGVVIKWIERHIYHIPAGEMREVFTMAGFKNIMQRSFNPLAPLLLTIGIKHEKEK